MKQDICSPRGRLKVNENGGKNLRNVIIRGITLTLCPRACAYVRNTLIAPINWICLVWGKAVAVNEARGTLYVWKEKRVG